MGRRSKGLGVKLFRKNSFLKNHKTLFIIILVILVFIIYISISLLAVSIGRIKLAELKRDMEKSGPCHEDCLFKRQNLELVIKNNLAGDKKLQNDFQEYFLAPDDTGALLIFKIELLKMMADVYGPNNPPEFLIDYLAKAAGLEELKVEIIKNFLAKNDDALLIDYYFSILNSAEGESLKMAAIVALSNVNHKQNLFRVEQVNNLKELALQESSSLNLRSNIVFLLSDYYLLFAEEVKTGLTSIYASAPEPIIKALAAESLNNFGNNEFIIPEIPETDWQNYFK